MCVDASGRKTCAPIKRVMQSSEAAFGIIAGDSQHNARTMDKYFAKLSIDAGVTKMSLVCDGALAPCLHPSHPLSPLVVAKSKSKKDIMSRKFSSGLDDTVPSYPSRRSPVSHVSEESPPDISTPLDEKQTCDEEGSPGSGNESRRSDIAREMIPITPNFPSVPVRKESIDESNTNNNAAAGQLTDAALGVLQRGRGGPPTSVAQTIPVRESRWAT